MAGMKTSMKTSLIIIALALLACVVLFVVFKSQPDDPVAANGSETSGGPSFEVRVVVPRGGLPLFGILPDWFVRKHDLTPREMGFDYTSPGAKVGVVRPHWIELFADGWNFFIEIDGEGRVAPGTHLEFPLGLGGRQLRLYCRPRDRPIGYLRTTPRAGSVGRLDGRFLVELAICKNAESGKVLPDWPPAPLTVSGSFVDLPPGRR